jgi:hypothetical protein
LHFSIALVKIVAHSASVRGQAPRCVSARAAQACHSVSGVVARPGVCGTTKTQTVSIIIAVNWEIQPLVGKKVTWSSRTQGKGSKSGNDSGEGVEGLHGGNGKNSSGLEIGMDVVVGKRLSGVPFMLDGNPPPDLLLSVGSTCTLLIQGGADPSLLALIRVSCSAIVPCQFLSVCWSSPSFS